MREIWNGSGKERTTRPRPPSHLSSILPIGCLEQANGIGA
mgnify:CR=1 FL=1